MKVCVSFILFAGYWSLTKEEHPTENSSLKTKNCTCGIIKGVKARVFGGAEAERIPWQVAILQHDSFFCGGSILNDRYILSAAHCFVHKSKLTNKVESYQKELFKFQFGANDLSALPFVRHAEAIILHEFFDLHTFVNDIAVCKLNFPIKNFDSNVLPVCLPPIGQSFENFKSMVAGWGKTEKKEIENSLIATIIQVYPRKLCEILYKGITKSFNSSIMMCGGAKDRDTCNGDSGGALVTKLMKYQYSQIGIVSAGLECGDFYHPGIFTRVSAFGDWILSKTQDGYFCNK